MRRHDDIRGGGDRTVDDLSVAQVLARRVDEDHRVPGSDERPTHHQQTEGHLMTDAAVGDGRLERRVEQQDLHRIACCRTAFPSLTTGAYMLLTSSTMDLPTRLSSPAGRR